MRFANLQYGILFLLIPLLMGWLLWSSKKRREDLARWGSSPFVERLLINFRPWEERLRAILLMIGVACLLMALLGPQWGFTWEKVSHRGVDVIVAVDASRSMLAEDIRPNRLERAKLAIHDLVNQLQGDRIGLITFAGTSFLQVPLTVDYNAVLQTVQSLTTDMIPQGGTAIGKAMDDALQAFEHVDAQNKVLLLITDGENHEGDPMGMAKKAKEAGIQVLTLGMGTKAGELIPVIENGQRQYVKDEEGNVVKSSLDEKLLKTIASTANGVYLPGSEPGVLDTLYDQYIGQLKKSEYSQTRKKHYHERFQIFLFPGILLLAAEMLIGTKRKVRR